MVVTFEGLSILWWIYGNKAVFFVHKAHDRGTLTIATERVGVALSMSKVKEKNEK